MTEKMSEEDKKVLLLSFLISIIIICFVDLYIVFSSILGDYNFNTILQSILLSFFVWVCVFFWVVISLSIWIRRKVKPEYNKSIAISYIIALIVTVFFELYYIRNNVNPRFGDMLGILLFLPPWAFFIPLIIQVMLIKRKSTEK